MSEMYEMDKDEGWKKSVGTILSSSKYINKIKVNYSLKNK